MAKAYEQIGEIKCHACDREAPLKKQRNGLASYTCPWCGFQGTSHYEQSSEHLRQRAGLNNQPAPAAEPPKAEPEPEPKPAKEPKKTMWGLPIEEKA